MNYSKNNNEIIKAIKLNIIIMYEHIMYCQIIFFNAIRLRLKHLNLNMSYIS